VSAGPAMKIAVAASKRNGISPANVEFGVRSKMIAPAMLPPVLATNMRTSVPRGTSISERKEPVEASEPSHIATLLVAFAGIGATPDARIAGNEMKLPPPAPALIALATNAAPPMNRSLAKFSARARGDALWHHLQQVALDEHDAARDQQLRERQRVTHLKLALRVFELAELRRSRLSMHV